MVTRNDIEIYSANNEGKFFVAKSSIRTLEKKLQIYDFNFKKCRY